MKVFVSSPLTENLDNNFLSQMENLIKEFGMEPVVPHHYKGKSATLEDEIKNNFALLDGSDMVIAEVTKPSHGVGMEILYAHQKKKGILFIKKNGARLSGMVAVHGKTIEYETFEDLREKLLPELRNNGI